MPRVIGLTGNIASGKTTVGRLLLELGAERYIDADALVHHLYGPDQSIACQVGAAFGERVLTTDGAVDRKALGEIVFYDKAAMRRLEQIVHPAVHQVMRQELAQVSHTGIAIIDAVKLLEGGSAAFCQSKWLVISSPEHQRARLMKRNGITEEEAQARLRAQPDNTAKIALVDEVITNDTSLEEMYQQVKGAFERFCQQFPA